MGRRLKALPKWTVQPILNGRRLKAHESPAQVDVAAHGNAALTGSIQARSDSLVKANAQHLDARRRAITAIVEMAKAE